MATVTRENIGHLHDKLTVKLSKEDYYPSFEKSLKQYAQRANVPGFRKGMVPGSLVKKMYGQSLFTEEVVRKAGDQLQDYLKQNSLSIFAQPMAMPSAATRLDMNQPADVDFDFEIGLKPEFDIAAVQNKAKVTLYEIEVTEKMIDDEVDRLSKRYGKAEEFDAVSGPEEVVTVSVQQGEEDAVNSMNSVGSLPEKLQQLLIGKSLNESFEVVPSELAEGEDLQKLMTAFFKAQPEQSGTLFTVTVLEVKETKAREINEEFFSEVFPNQDVKDEATFRDKLRAELRKEYDRIAKDRLNSELFELLVHDTKINLPVPFLKRWLAEGQEKPVPADKVEQEFSSFDHQLRWTLISDKLIQENHIEVTMDDVRHEIRSQVLSYFGMGNDAIAEWMDGYMAKVEKDEKTINETYRRLLFDRLFSWLREHMTVETKTISEEEFFKLPDAHTEHHH